MEYETAEYQRGGERKLKGETSERETNHEGLLTLGNKLRVAGAGGRTGYLGDGR